MKFNSRLTNSLAFKICLIGFLGLGLGIPLQLIGSLTSERQSYSNQAITEVISKWGDTPILYGPFLDFSSTNEKSLVQPEGLPNKHISLPTQLDISGKLEDIKLNRGLFQIPVYKGEIDFSGVFRGLDKIKDANNLILWNDAKLVFLIAEPKSLKSSISLSVLNGSKQIPFQPGREYSRFINKYPPQKRVHPPSDYHHFQSIEASLKGILTLPEKAIDDKNRKKKKNASQRKRKLTKRQKQKLQEELIKKIKLKHKLAVTNLDFSFKLNLHGSQNIFLLPAGETTKIKLQSNWPHPKFSGDFLPTKRNITSKGFSAEWNIPLFSRGQSQTFHNNAISGKAVQAGVSFFEPTNIYVLNERSLKYALISIAVIFLSVFIVELYSRQAVHWIQYMFVGFALVVFYFLLLGISEHFGFKNAYIAASGATGLLIGTYIASVTGRILRGIFVMIVLSMIYAMLYMLLNATDYAMLVGSITVFILLAITMFATRNVDWSNTRLIDKENEADTIV